MSKYGERIDHNTVRFTRTLPGPIERVWGYLVEDELRGKWFCGGTTDPKMDGAIELVFEHGDLSPLPDDPPPAKHAKYEGRTTSSGKVSRWEPHHAFAFIWFGDGEDSEVLFELTEAGDEVRLVLTHTRLATREAMVSVLGGWHAHLDILEDVLNDVVPVPFWKRFTPLDEEYEAKVES